MISTEETVMKTATEEVTHDLIRGDFKAEEAAEFINHMLSSKINFHHRRDFSSQIRFGENDHDSLNRIDELKQSREEIVELLEYAKANNIDLRISSTISIQLIEENAI